MEAQQDNYRTSGFAYAGATTRFTGRITEGLGRDIRAVDPQEIQTLIQMEAAASGVSKPNYLHPWLVGSGKRTTFVKDEESACAGFCTVRTCQTGAKVGPLVATNIDVARELIAHASAGIDGPISIDVPSTSVELFDLCQMMGWQSGFQTARMYKGAFTSPGHGCFAVGSLELG